MSRARARHSAITVLAKPAEGVRPDAICERLRVLGDRVRGGALQGLDQVSGLHFLCATWLPGETEDDGAGDAGAVLLEGEAEDDAGAGDAGAVLLEMSVDGTRRAFLQRFCETASGFLHEVFEGCAGAPQTGAAAQEWVRFLEARDIGYDAFYIGNPGRSVSRIKQEQKLASALHAQSGDAATTATAQQGATRSERWQALVRALLSGEQADVIRDAPRQGFFVRLNLIGRGPARRTPSALKLLARLVLFALGNAAFALLALETLRTKGGAPGELLLLALPMAGVLALAVLCFRERPRALRFGALLKVLGRQAREVAGVGLALTALCGGLWLLPQLPWDAVAGLTALGFALFVALFISTPLGGLLALLRFGAGAGFGALGLGALLSGAHVFARSDAAFLFAAESLAASALFCLATFGVTLLWLGRLRRLEESEARTAPRPGLEHLEAVTRNEDLHLQNHYAAITTLLPKRLGIMRGVLRVVNLAARILFVRGDLGGIPTIHFARFVILPGARRMLFLSNYDGPWTAYLDAFSTVNGVTAVWGNTRGFPRPFLLVADGARRVRALKEFGRAMQVESLLWYSAYPELSVTDIDAASRLCRDIGRGQWDGDRGIFATIRRIWNDEMDEVERDAALRRTLHGGGAG